MQKHVVPGRVLAKGLILFLLFEFALLSSNWDLGKLNIYPSLGLSRSRFPSSTQPSVDAALDVGNLDAMFASHTVSRPKAPDEFRVLVLGDSAAWGALLPPDQTLPGQLDSFGLSCGDKHVRVYNLSYPRSSATKDLMILDKAMQYQPDLVVWMVTLYTLMPKTRVDHWLITQNPGEFYQLAKRFGFLPRKYPVQTPVDQVINKHRALFRVLRYQLYSMVHLATGIDQIQNPYAEASAESNHLPLEGTNWSVLTLPRLLPDQAGGSHPPANRAPTIPELSTDLTFEGMVPPTLTPQQLSLDQISDFYQLADKTPIILVNEPIMLLEGVPNSDIRYNVYYPRWVYDQYRQYLGQAVAHNHWDYLDLWNMFPPDYFTNTPLHLNADGQRQLAEAIAPSIRKACP
jgi:hypothetical protein